MTTVFVGAAEAVALAGRAPDVGPGTYLLDRLRQDARWPGEWLGPRVHVAKKNSVEKVTVSLPPSDEAEARRRCGDGRLSDYIRGVLLYGPGYGQPGLRAAEPQAATPAVAMAAPVGPASILQQPPASSPMAPPAEPRASTPWVAAPTRAGPAQILHPHTSSPRNPWEPPTIAIARAPVAYPARPPSSPSPEPVRAPSSGVSEPARKPPRNPAAATAPSRRPPVIDARGSPRRMRWRALRRSIESELDDPLREPSRLYAEPHEEVSADMREYIRKLGLAQRIQFVFGLGDASLDEVPGLRLGMLRPVISDVAQAMKDAGEDRLELRAAYALVSDDRTPELYVFAFEITRMPR